MAGNMRIFFVVIATVTLTAIGLSPSERRTHDHPRMVLGDAGLSGVLHRLLGKETNVITHEGTIVITAKDIVISGFTFEGPINDSADEEAMGWLRMRLEEDGTWENLQKATRRVVILEKP